jgi:predicted Zn-dependent protease
VHQQEGRVSLNLGRFCKRFLIGIAGYGGFVGSGLTGCQTTPVTDRRQLMLVNDQDLAREGVKVFKEMRQKIPVVRDERLRKEVMAVSWQVIEATGEKLDWDIELFDSPEVNAFCLPGGKIGIFRGILPVAKTNGGLAAVIGHEVAHALAHHSAERASQAFVVDQVVGVLDASLEGKQGRPLIVGALNFGAQLGLMLPFNRHQESEADAIGLQYMARAGYNPEEAVMLWVRMAAQDGSKPPEWLSTHPDPQRRIRDLERLQVKAGPVYQAQATKRPTQNLF